MGPRNRRNSHSQGHSKQRPSHNYNNHHHRSLISGMDYEEALNLFKDRQQNPYIQRMTEPRHVTIGWQFAGNLEKALRNSVNATVGQYRPGIDAVPLAIGPIIINQQIPLLESQPVIHLDIEVSMVAFKLRVKKGDNPPVMCTAVKVDGNSVIGRLYNVIMVVHSPTIPNLKCGDLFPARIRDDGVFFRHNLCQLRTTSLTPAALERLGIKQEPKEEDDDEEE